MCDSSIKRVFLSYSRLDLNAARPVVDALDAKGLEVFWDDRISGGAQWQNTLEQELYRCDLLLVLIGSQGVSGWVKPEVGVALNRYHDKERKDPLHVATVSVAV